MLHTSVALYEPRVPQQNPGVVQPARDHDTARTSTSSCDPQNELGVRARLMHGTITLNPGRILRIHTMSHHAYAAINRAVERFRIAPPAAFDAGVAADNASQ